MFILQQKEYGQEGYFGFGLDSWKSGPQTFSNIGKFASHFSTGEFSRNFGDKISFILLLREMVGELDDAISLRNV